MSMSLSSIAVGRNDAVPAFPPDASAAGQRRFVDWVRESLHVKCHSHLLLWLQGPFQRCIPHQILIATWGDFSLGAVQHDVVSSITSIRTGHIDDTDITRITGDLFRRWLNQNAQPFRCDFEGLPADPQRNSDAGFRALQAMKSVLVHGVRDERSRHDCLYVFLSADPHVDPAAEENLRMVIPFVDAALRQVSHLPCQYPTESSAAADGDADPSTDQFLSERELEIMEWVRLGKTNYEIGIILNISTFTVKNHLQRIFRKLDVTNRAQAASQVQEISQSSDPLAAALAHCDNCPRTQPCR